MMAELVCTSESVYRKALTRGKKYAVLATDDAKRQVRIQGDNGRTRWFPMYCFDQSGCSVPTLVGYELDDPIKDARDIPVEVTVELSTGERRWCVFATPKTLASCGRWVEGAQIRFHYGNRHLIVAEELSEELIGRMLRHINAQGELAECTLPLQGEPSAIEDEKPE